MKHFVKYHLIPLLSMVLVCAFPCVFLYARNADEVPASSMLPFLLVFLVTSLGIFLLGSLFFRNVSRAAFFSDMAMLVVINFCFVGVQLRTVMPFLRDRYLLVIFGAVLLLLFILLLWKKPDMRVGCLLLALAFGAITVMNLILAVPAILRAHQVREYRGEEQQETGIVFGENRPNVYLFLFDEYGGYKNLLHYYDYDNSPFLEELEARGFSVSRDSRNSEAVATDTIVPNLLNLDYVVTPEDTGHLKKVYRDYPFLTRMFLENGYQVNLINHVDYLGTTGCRVLTSNQTRRTISELLMRNSIFNKSMYLRMKLEEFFTVDYGANYRASLDNALEMGLRSVEETQGKPTLTIGYIQCPHSPTMVGPHGEELSFAEGWNWRKHELYLGQVAFINDYILRLVDTIREKDPDSLILLESDHGNRYAIHMVQLGEWEDYDPREENPYMQNILNCISYPGMEFQIAGETGINSLRTAFREVLGAELPPIATVEDYSMVQEDEQQ